MNGGEDGSDHEPRFVGVSDPEVNWAQVLGVFAFARLLTAVPITPGGLGIVEVAYIGGLILAGRGHADVPTDVFHAQVTTGRPWSSER